MKSKKVSDSRVEIAQIMYPEHANPAGNVHGGHILKLVDQAAAIAGARHTHRNVVTASVDRMDFISPVYIGNVVFAKASINYAGRTSMEIGVRIEAECLRTGTHTHVGSAYLTFVALDENDKPTEIPKIIPETEEEKRRFEEAKRRRESRLQQAKKKRAEQQPCIIRTKKLN
ncbi:MAG: acyl-CoA thioesterase [Promethearchaeota archaeon]|nr:MAG: acyl-CoA thioesterase [Candidatus Lokiarchaeota archaeon]